jgi:dTDP-glucose 4,6-dehydratase
MENLTIPIYGNGQNTRDWIHVEDHCRALYLVLTNGNAGEIYNIGGGKELKNIDLAEMLVTLTGKDLSSIEYVADRLGHDIRYSVNSEKITQQLGFEPSIDFNEGLESTIEWYRDNESWWR